ncbi:MAG: chromate efflux transporter [Bacteroidota bacterium]
MTIKQVRYYIFLKDVLVLAVTAFGGPQVHIALFIERFVEKRGYLSEQELMELNALCQILPGPTSTQTITAIGFRIGGIPLAYLTLLVWALPAVSIMTGVALGFTFLKSQSIFIDMTHYIQPMAVGFIAYAGYRISVAVIESKSGIVVMILSAILAFMYASPYLFPFLIILGGVITALKYKKQNIVEKTEPLKIKWDGFILWGGILIIAGAVATFTNVLPLKIFENFYRNGSLIFGGGQVLIPLLYAEFVEVKHYLSSSEFLSGYGFAQAVPGPVFSFSAYVGSLSMREYGVLGKIAGGFIASLGIFLPGTFLIFFVYRIWGNLKRYRIIRASLEGITAASSGMVVAAALLLFQPLPLNWYNPTIVIGTFALLQFTKWPPPIIILGGLLLGAIF